MEAGLGDPKDGGYTRYEKDDDCRPSEAQELLRHKFMGYVLSVTAFLNSGDGLMYKNPTTGEEVRVMPNPGRTPYRGEPPAKFDNDWYYRYRSGSDQTWGPHTTLPDK